MGSESIAHSAFGLMGYWPRAHSARGIIVNYTPGSSLCIALINSNVPHVSKLFNQVDAHPTLLPSYVSSLTTHRNVESKYLLKTVLSDVTNVYIIAVKLSRSRTNVTQCPKLQRLITAIQTVKLLLEMLYNVEQTTVYKIIFYPSQRFITLSLYYSFITILRFITAM